MCFTKLEGKPNLPKIQQDVLKFWEENDTFKKSLKKPDNKEVVFYDGPPFPTGKPHHGTVLVSFIKDMIARYWTMRGYKVDRQWGWDCHGLPIENQVETLLKIQSKLEIENNIGIDTFNNQCYNLVSESNEAWTDYVREMARWVDYDGSYKTMDKNYMESVIWAFKESYNKGLIYKDYRVTPYCYKCQTSLSISDTRESDSTRPRQDTWVLAKFKAEQTLNNKPVYFLAWTTTPWTLPSNMALAVGININYVYVELENEVLLLAQTAIERFKKVVGDNPQIIKTVNGNDLLGLQYQPLLPYFKNLKDSFVVISADYVDANDGSGIVHIAPAFGEDDYWACKKHNIPLVNPVDEAGIFTEEVWDFAGKNVLEANKEIIKYLKNNNLIADSGSIEHNYPHCWRCRTPLIYKAMDAWYFNIDKIKGDLLKLNQEINWVPESVKNGRFGNWLENARDWNISRNRYWSTPLPVWECECGHREVLGSIDEIYQKSGIKLSNLHREYMDKATYPCPKCNKQMKRIEEVLDCWFESGAVPFARLHYPFENKEWFEKNTTSDFVVEYTGQIRGWFYYLLVLSGALFNKKPFKNAIVHGTVLAKDGKKLSKSSRNYTDPMDLMKKHGTDAFRLYMYNSSAMLLGDLQFEEEGILEAVKTIILPFWSACSFFETYSKIDGFKPDLNIVPTSQDELDKWMLAKLYATYNTITTNMDNYQIDNYVMPISSLINDLTNWYIRRSRRRFWAHGLDEEKTNSYQTLYYVLVNITKLLAPLTPIISEKIYKILTKEESVHLSDWPNISSEFENAKLIEEISLLQDTIHIARALRSKNKIKIRQPLNTLYVALSDKEKLTALKKHEEELREELNVKNFEAVSNVEKIATIVYKPNFSTLPEQFKSRIPQIIKALKLEKISLSGNDVTLQLENENIQLSKENIIVEYHAKSGYNVLSDKGIVVSLDLNITQELLQEGIARDIVRQVQEARKQLDLEVTDKIILNLSGNYPKEWIEFICGETLSSIGDFENARHEEELETENGLVKIRIK